MKTTDMPHAEAVLVTPDKAREWLKANVENNRRLSQFTVADYVELAKRGEWDESNGETIKFDRDGSLIDGQHRLAMVVALNKPMWFLVAYNCSRRAFMTIDTGKPRGAADILSIGQHENCNVLASSLTLLWRYMNGAVCGTHKVSNQTINGMSADHPDMAASVRLAISVRGPKGFLAPSIVAFIHYMAKRRSGATKAEAFVRGVVMGETYDHDSAIRMLRQRLIGNLANKRPMKRADVVAICIKAWNMFAKGETATPNKLRWRSNGDSAEAFPKIAA